MSYGYSDQERENLKWFEKDCTRQSLKSIEIRAGQLRGLSKCKISFTYPISAIAGENGSGKSTILALAACAFHNKSSGWRLPDRKLPYYTFSDFFIQASEDVPLDGVFIVYGIAHNKWKPIPSVPAGIGLAFQVRKKNKGGKWNDYDKRVSRSVGFLGIERVVPPSERSVYKSYRYSFSSLAKTGWEDRVRESVSRVLGVKYEDFEIKTHGRYRLPLVQRPSARYSGFNMGAGEKALFELFAAIYAAPDGSLFLVDELELGLHESAQGRLVGELSSVCAKQKMQFICTTHSPQVLAALPPEGRFLVQPGASTYILDGVSPDFAAGQLRGVNSTELKVFVEDDTAATLVEAALDDVTLERVRIVPIGSHSAVVHQLAAHLLEDRNCHSCMAFLDGDQFAALAAHRASFLGWLGSHKDVNSEQWIDQRLHFLPGNTSPELWVLKNLAMLSDKELTTSMRVNNAARIRNAINTAMLSQPHSQIYALANTLGINKAYAWRDCCMALWTYRKTMMKQISNAVTALL